MTVVEQRPIVVRGTPSVRRRVRWLPTLAAVVAVLVVAELGVRLLEHRLPPPSGWVSDEYPIKRDRMADLAGTGGVGVALVGSSVMDVSVDPALLSEEATGGRGAYNAALIGATPVIVDIWTRELVVPELRPDVVVVAVSSRDLNGNGASMRQHGEDFVASPGGSWLLGSHSIADAAEWWLLEHSALIRHRESLRRPLEAVFGYDPPDRTESALTDLGLQTHLVDDQYRRDRAIQDFFRQQPLRDFAVTDDQLDAVRRLASALETSGIRVVLLDVPVTDDYVELHPRGEADVAAYTAAVDEISTATGAEVLRPGRWPAELFSDPLHLNGAGVRRLSAAVDAYLAAGR
jgi:hypothetical protein